MSDFIHIAGWTQYNHRRSLQHIRSLSGSSTKTITKSISTTTLPTMATVSNAPGLPTHRSFAPYMDHEENLSTLPDPRSRVSSPTNDPPASNQEQYQELSNAHLSEEVTALSKKLINAINHQTSLDDSLSATRHELEASRERTKQLERENREHKALVSSGILIRSSVAEAEKAKILAILVEEKNKRREVEKDKKSIELELENLTTALFEEANKMVIMAREQARKEYDIVNKKNDQLKAQLQEAQNLLKSQQEQLAELKQVMEHMTEEQEDQINQPSGTAPSTPALYNSDPNDEKTNNSDSIQSSSIPEPVSPSYPTSFVHLVQPVLRTDLGAYDDFISLLRMSKNIVISSRASSGSYGAIGLGLGLGAYTGSTSSISTLGTYASSPATPTTPASNVSSGSRDGPNSLTPLKETKFYKRALAEDIEPTLRLDNAPGLSWLARRTVLNAVCEGSLVVEPMPSSIRPYAFPCSLCGETRKGPEHIRNHRFRTSESDNAQRYPLCLYCLGRVRSTCGFMSFLRVLKEGHWRGEDEESDKAAWEESVRLRERMFWCRIGGGVIPCVQSWNQDSSRNPRLSDDERRRKLSEESDRSIEIIPRDITPTSELSPVNITGFGRRSGDGEVLPSPLREEVEISNIPDVGSEEATAIATVSILEPKPEEQEKFDVGTPEPKQEEQETEQVSNAKDVHDANEEEHMEPEKTGHTEESHGAADDMVQSKSSVQNEEPIESNEDLERLPIAIPGAF
ncbi:4b8766aa-7b15-441d-ba93-d3a0ebced8b2 [Sclerotinia trifoliorum]|uniref:4b8766aa-7b15-441d-ba93-d3a0ebced8b2 n=1 Tax=Sclerotinia trifoliorum TaxID=28548 RepID=A0A8H2W1F3_9HELO|nr:4b8766aa-7b15-441d-ba93-d3a0ebced8b2 [Sclerotinia trifoliorum]